MGVARGCECVFVTVCRVPAPFKSSKKQIRWHIAGARDQKDHRTVQGTGGGLMDAMSDGSVTFFFEFSPRI